MTKCVRRGNDRFCSVRLLLNSIVVTGVNGTEWIEVEAVTGSDGVYHKLSNPLQLSVSKSPVFVRYSMVYVGDVNGKPKENVGGTSMLNCATDPSSLYTNGVCGSTYMSGKRISYSEGFCCPCSFDQMIGLGSHQRGNIVCNPFSALFGTGASVHCLRWGSLWYSLFTPMTPTVESTVEISAAQSSLLTVSAQNPMASTTVNNTVNITARLVGSFAWQRPPTDWGLSVYAVALNVAASTSSDDPRITTWSPTNPFRHGVFVPISDVDLSGKTCNKIGVSHDAFVNNQAERCSGSVGDCLGNQLDDRWASSTLGDLIPTRACSWIGGKFVENDGYRLSCRLDDSSSDVPTQVLIELNASEVQIVTNSSEGIITNVTTTQSIHALVQVTSVFMTIQNTGDLDSEFIAAVSTCTPATLTLPLSGTRISIRAKERFTTNIKIEDSDVNGSNYTCLATLSDSDGNLLDSNSFNLEISDVLLDRGAQEGAGTSIDSSDSPSNSEDACTTTCSGFFDLLCFISHLCWPKLGTLLGTVGGLGLGLFLITKLGGWSIIWRFLKGCFSCCCSASSTKQEQENQPIDRHQTDAVGRSNFPKNCQTHPFYYYYTYDL